MENFYIRIARKNWVTYNGENTIILNRVEQHILKNTIAKFGFRLKIPKLRPHMIEYRADPNHSLYRAFKKAETYLDVLNVKAEMQKELEWKSSYKAFKTFQAIVASEQNPQLRPYKAASQKAQSYIQPGLSYRNRKWVDHNTSYPDRNQEPHQFRNVYSSKDARVPQSFYHPLISE